MRKNYFSTLFLLSFIFLIACKAFSQEKKDTIYFDENWSICERPVAEYYRVCVLNKTEKDVFYTGSVKDYYIDGRLEMTGYYSEFGIKNGDFIFYNKKGVVIKQGNFLNNEMMGDWFYYDSTHKLQAQFFCRSSLDFVPIFLINNNNETVVKDGNGTFSLSTEDKYNHLAPVFYANRMEGTVHNGVKNGEFKYYAKQELLYTEKYEDGRFLKAVRKNYNYSEHVRDQSFLFSLSDINLLKTDILYHSNIVFGPDPNGLQKLSNYLLHDISPEIQPQGQSSYMNDAICFGIIFRVISDEIKQSAGVKLPAYLNDINVTLSLSTLPFPKENIKAVKKLDGDIVITIDTTGKAVNSSFNGGFTTSEIQKLTYYFQHLTHLAVTEKDSIKVERQLRLKLKTVIDSEANNLLTVRYVLLNIDSANINATQENGQVQVEAKFPGGQDAWHIYLERNLNAQTPSDHRAPSGNYTVTVSFMVDANGNVSDVRADNDPGYGTAEEAVRVIKKGPKWVPAIQNGKNVNYRQKQNITFQVSGR